MSKNNYSISPILVRHHHHRFMHSMQVLALTGILFVAIYTIPANGFNTGFVATTVPKKCGSIISSRHGRRRSMTPTFFTTDDSPKSKIQSSSSSSLLSTTSGVVDDGNELSKAFATPTESIIEIIDPTTKNEIRNIAHHLASQTFETLLSPSDANAIMDELFFTKSSSSSPIFNDKSYEQYVKYWNKVERKLRKESEKTPANLLGKELTNRILSSIRGDSTNNNKKGSSNYDPQTVRTFLESDAINSLFSRLLYDAIFEFTIKIDIIGNAISGLPLLGPVRNQVLKESKKQMDRTLGPLVQRFLSGYTRVAIRQAVEFVVSEENASAFGKANARLVQYLLEKRTVAEWIPEERQLGEWREEVWSYLVGLEVGEGEGGGMVKEDQKQVVEQSIQWTYDLVGDKCVNDAGLDVDAILDSSPTLERKLGSFWKRCQDASKSSTN